MASDGVDVAKMLKILTDSFDYVARLAGLEQDAGSHHAIAAVAVAVLALMLMQLCGSQKNGKDMSDIDEPMSPVCQDFRLCPPEVEPLRFRQDQLPMLDREVCRIYAVDHDKPPLGTGMKPSSGSFRPPKDVTSSLLQLRAACAEFDQGCAAGKWRSHEPLDDLFLSRHLIAADFDIARAAKLVQGYSSWRRELRGGVPPSLAWLKLGIACLPFEDVMGRPVILARARYFDAALPAEQFKTFYRGIVDAVIAHLLLKRTGELSETNPLEQYVLVLDVMGASRRNFAMSGVKVMVGESNTNYPDRLAQIFVLGVNMMVQGLWSMVSPMVHPRTRNKVTMANSNQTPALMRKLIGRPELLPPEYGGTGPELPAPEDARSLEDQAGRLAADAWRTLGATRFLEMSQLAGQIRAAWSDRGNFKLWIKSRGETSACVRSVPECVAFLLRLERGLQPGSPRFRDRPGCCSGGDWLGGCLSERAGGRSEERDVEQLALSATRSPQDLERRLSEICSDDSGSLQKAVIDFVTGQKEKDY
eukprot:gb/GFBE01081160.1/.p1 GENE.gb/GFBE01081160.1/~~gb/GFBE01081160.1/.p1  ORF type:complete len:531 (+),score=88.95 gb/GFBE01081160.1/:1-1593(+)